jgi:hypothetical protein
MKRYTVIKHLLTLMDDNDVLIFSGSEVCKEAYAYDKENYFYIKDSVGMAASFGLGMAMCTDKRVFVFIGEGEFLRDLGIIAQIGSSECKNLFLVLLDNKCYQAAGGHPSVFENVLSKKALIYNSNIKVKTFTSHFKLKEFKRLKNVVARLVGPMVILMDVDKGVRKALEDVEIDFEEQRDRIQEFILDHTKETAMVIPMAAPMPDMETITLNLDGGNG